MFSVFRAILDRVKALFASSAALELEADLVAHVAECKAALLRQATRYDAEGLHSIADHLRRQAEELSVQRPLAGVLPAIAHLNESSQAGPLLRLIPEPQEDRADTDSPRSSPSLPLTTKPIRRRKS